MAGEKLYDVEHALNICALSFVYLPAAWLYDNDRIERLSESIAECHVYLIGLVANCENGEIREERGGIVSTHRVLGIERELFWQIPDGWTLATNKQSLINAEGDVGELRCDDIMRRLGINFEVVYIGQAYGKDGSRNALDRLLKHETLQNISLTGVPKDHSLQILLLKIDRDNRIITVFDPNAINKDISGERISNGLDKLFDSNEAELVTLYEASLIRYFRPRYNIEFKNSFPSNNMKVLGAYSHFFGRQIAFQIGLLIACFWPASRI